MQYILHLKNQSHQGNLIQRFSQVLVFYFFINDDSVSSNHNIDMTRINTRMFGITFEVGLLFASFKISTFMNKPLFIHTSEKL